MKYSNPTQQYAAQGMNEYSLEKRQKTT